MTIASNRYMALARVTAQSFLSHNPDIAFFVVLADEENDRLNLAHLPFQTIRLDSLELPEPERFKFQYSELEFSYALTPFAIDHLLSEGFDGVIFLKQETLVLDDLGPVLADLAHHSVLLTPHFLEQPERPDAMEWEINVLRAGIFNGGVLAFSNCPEAREFLAWWQERTFGNCVMDVENGLHYEQRWLDFAPTLMPNYGLIRDPGVNVGHWNLPDRDIKVIEGQVTAKGVPCRVFRFSGYDPDNPGQVTKYNRSYRVADTGDAARVFDLYHTMLMAAAHQESRQLPYAFGKFDNGVAINPLARKAYRRQGDGVRRFGNPFETAPEGSYFRWFTSRIPWRRV